MYTTNRESYRQTFFEAWQKYLAKKILEPIEARLIEVILIHPEYHALLEKPSNENFSMEENPFLHMSLHLALREQIQTNRPAGIKKIYDQLAHLAQDTHALEHRMMTCLADMIWKAQQTGIMPDDKDYLEVIIERCSNGIV